MSSDNEVNDVSKDNRIRRCLSLDTFGLIYRIVDCLLLFAVLLYQNSSLSYYITAFNAHNNGWYFLFFVDFVLTVLFMSGAFLASRHYRRLHLLKNRRIFSSSSDQNKFESNGSHERHQIFNTKFAQSLGILPLLWICWVLYAIVMSSKIFVLHLQDIVLHFYNSSEFKVGLEANEEHIDVEPHTLRLCMASMTVVFLLWIEIHRNYDNKDSMDCIKELTTTVVFEIFDSIDLLGLLLPDSAKDLPFDSSHADRLSVMILVLATVNLLLPTIGLYRLSQRNFSSHKLGLRMNILHNLLRISLVNIPYMLLRISFWITVKKELSIFLLKNALFVFIGIRHIISEVHELNQLKDKPKDNEMTLNVLTDGHTSGDNPIDE